ncbi:unnamed protein product [Clavelina lepadiformis]|uniref:OCEL domain-containing protein n=1 Tax=Clavelina lepadiformis TaxID=159417 RepID=A0ABP0GQE0_CLALP
MAIELYEGEYALQQNAPKKTVLQLKLTDSALNAIELFQNKAVDCRWKPAIQFEGNQGNIQIPTGDGVETQTFTFQLASLAHADSVNCVQQYHSRTAAGQIAIVGGIQQKITINANDDSYNVTRKKMTFVKEQEQKISTKVIKHPSGSKMGKKKQGLHRQILDQHAGRNGTPPPNRGSSNHSFTRSASPHTTSTMRSVSPISGVGDLAGVRNKTKPTMLTISSNNSSSQNSSSQKLLTKLGDSSSNRKRPIISPDSTPKDFPQQRLEENYTNPVKKKQRVSHLSKTSPNTPARPRSVSPLESSTTLLSVDNPISTSINSSSVVDLDDTNISGLGLAETSSKLSRRNSPKICSEPADAGSRKSSKLVKPNYSPSDIPISPGKASPHADSYNMSGHSSTVNSKRPSKVNRGISPLRPNRSEPKTRPDSRGNDRAPASKKQNMNEPIQDRANSSFASVADSFSRHDPGPDNLPEDDTEKKEFIKNYPAIDFAEQRDRYKSDFYAEYKEYLELHEIIAQESQRFDAFQEELSREERGTEEYKAIARRVVNEYHKLKGDDKYCRDRQRMQYLHRKLKHIKDVVLEFDCRQFEQKPNASRRDGEESRREKRERRGDRPYAHRRPLLTA